MSRTCSIVYSCGPFCKPGSGGINISDMTGNIHNAHPLNANVYN